MTILPLATAFQALGGAGGGASIRVTLALRSSSVLLLLLLTYLGRTSGPVKQLCLCLLHHLEPQCSQCILDGGVGPGGGAVGPTDSQQRDVVPVVNATVFLDAKATTVEGRQNGPCRGIDALYCVFSLPPPPALHRPWCSPISSTKSSSRRSSRRQTSPSGSTAGPFSVSGRHGDRPTERQTDRQGPTFSQSRRE